MGKTGGGKAEFGSLNAVEEMAVGVIGETAIVGIDEGLDSYVNDQTHNERKNDNGNSSNDEHTQYTQTHNTHHEENINLYIDIVEPHNDPPFTSTTDQEFSVPCKVETKKSRNASYNMEESNKPIIEIERKSLPVEGSDYNSRKLKCQLNIQIITTCRNDNYTRGDCFHMNMNKDGKLIKQTIRLYKSNSVYDRLIAIPILNQTL